MNQSITKRSFLRGLLATSAATIAAKPQGQTLDLGNAYPGQKLIEYGYNLGSLNKTSPASDLLLPPSPCNQECLPALVTRTPWTEALRSVHEKQRFLEDTSRRRSGQFTSHEEKRELWIRRREWRRFAHGPYRYPDMVKTIHQWKAEQTLSTKLGNTLSDAKSLLEAACGKQS